MAAMAVGMDIHQSSPGGKYLHAALQEAKPLAPDFIKILSFCRPETAGIVLAAKCTMNLICEHCDEMIVGNAYRVTSEEDGIVLLDMIVCSICGMEAKRLQLHTEVVDSGGAEASGPYKRDQRSRMRM